ncbi:MAG: DUF4153 domain-containing protein [Bacillota bacterium]
MRLRELLTRMMNSARPTVKRFWASILFCIAMTTTLIVSTRGFGIPGSIDSLNRLSLAFAAGVLASWCAVLLWERFAWEKKQEGSELTGNLVALLSAGVIGAITYAMLKHFSLVPMTRHFAICFALFLAFFVIPGYRRGARLEMYVVRLFAHAVVAVLFSAVMFIGISSITLTFTSLFSIKTAPELYLHIWMVMAGVLAPFLFMAGIPVAGADVEGEEYPKTLKNLVIYVVTPLLTAYTLVLYLYFAKILITRQWPVGLVAHLVLWYSIVSLAVLHFVWPLERSNKWAGIFSRYFPRTVIPLLLMMFASLGIRVRYYGITENRYYVGVVGLWVLASALYLGFAKQRNRVILPATLAIVVLMSVFGPWSSFSVAKWSQNRRFEEIVTRNNMVVNGAIVPAPPQISDEDRRETAAVLQYFERFHSLSDVRLLPAGFTMAEFEKVFGFKPYDIFPSKPTKPIFFEAPNRAIEVSGYRYLFDYSKPQFEDGPVSAIKQDDIEVAYNRETHGVTLTLGGVKEWEQSLVEYIKVLRAQHLLSEPPQIRPEDMIFEAETESLRIKVVFVAVYADADDTNAIILHRAEFLVLVGPR